MSIYNNVFIHFLQEKKTLQILSILLVNTDNFKSHFQNTPKLSTQ